MTTYQTNSEHHHWHHLSIQADTHRICVCGLFPFQVLLTCRWFLAGTAWLPEKEIKKSFYSKTQIEIFHQKSHKNFTSSRS